MDTGNQTREVADMKKRKCMALFMAGAMGLSLLAGCGKGVAKKSKGTEDSKDKGSYNVVLENVTLGAKYKDTEAVEKAINAITEPAIGCTVTILNVGIADHGNRMSMMVAGGEKVDLCMTGLTTNLASMVNDGMLCELDDYMDTVGKDLKEILGKDLEAGKINGTLYGITGNNASAMATGFLYNKKIADEAGVNIPQKCSMEEFLAAYEKIREKNPALYLTSLGDGGASVAKMMRPLSALGDGICYSYGVIADPLSGSTKVENWFATKEAKEHYAMIKEWQEKKFVPSDSMTSGVIPQDLFKASQSLGVFSAYSPMELPTQAPNYEFETGIVQLSDSFKDTDMVQERMWGVPVTSENPEKAVEFLNFMYTNTDVANLLSHGLEGTNYEKTDQKGIITKLDGANPGYARIFTTFGNQTQIYYNTPAKEGIQEELKKFSDSAKAAKTLGYVFDSTPVAAKAAAVSKVVQQYGPSLEVGLVDDVDKALAQLAEGMESAGIKDIIAENQSQLDKWLATQK